MSDPGELVELCALDSELYGRTFFPEAVRQPSPPFHREIYELLEDRKHRYVGFECFRGSAKTTILRVYTSKRIAYGASRTILYVSKGQDHAKLSLQWLKKAIEFNRAWTGLYGLERGSRWTDELIEIRHLGFRTTVTVVALGITGQIRGVNIDDYRPDLIVVDDPCDEENTATPDQRRKIEDLFFGALQKSLAPPSESPDAKMALLQTPLAQEDLIQKCKSNSSWVVKTFGCFDEEGRSRWPQRYSDEYLRKEREAHVALNKVALWAREMECRLTDEGTCLFKQEWLRYWEVLPDGMVTFLAIDPVPPPSDAEVARGLKGKDYEVLTVVGAWKGRRYILEQSASRGHEPSWTVSEFFRLVDKWGCLRCRVEGVAYQRTLKWLLEQEMVRRRRYVQINSVADRRKKLHRIAQAFSGIASQGQLYVHRSMVDFIQQFSTYPYTPVDDHLDSAAMGIDEADESRMGDGEVDMELGDDGVYALPEWRTAP